jgi:hypothetical protein
MALVVHPYIMGALHRRRYFREALQHIRGYSDVLFWTGELSVIGMSQRPPESRTQAKA